MTAAKENLIRGLLPNNEEVMFGELIGELNFTKCVLEKLFEADEAPIPQEEFINYVLRLAEVSERIQNAETPRQKWDIYYSEYRPLSNEIKIKYGDFLDSDTFKEIEAHEKYVDGLKELIIAQGLMLVAFEEETDKVYQFQKLYTGMVRLSELLEEYLLYFPQELIDYIKSIASGFLSDSSLKPDRNSQSEQVFSYLIGLKNTARAILWQIEEHRVKNGMLPTKLLGINPDIARQIQIQKNQVAIEWAKSRLEQIENIKKAKGYKF